MNIVAMAAQYMTPMIVDKLAKSLGITSPLAQKAIAAIVPTILASILGSSQKPEGLKNLTDILGKQDPGMLGKLGDLIGGANQAGMVTAGTNVLGSLLGNAALGQLTSIIGKFSGVGDAPAKGLLGLVGPVTLGALAKQQQEAKLDGAGLAKMLLDQKDNITKALPPGLSDLLKGTGLLDAVATPAKPATPAPAAKPAAAAPAPKPSPMPVQPAPAPKKGGSWLPWALALVAILGGGWFFLSNRLTTALPAVPAITVGNQNVGAQLGTVVEGLRGTMLGIKDVDSARAALPRLQETVKQLDGLNEVRGRMSAADKGTLATYIKQLLPMLRPMIDKGIANAGASPQVKAIADTILNKLEAMAKG